MGAVKRVEDLMGAHIGCYVKIDYKAAEKIVDAMGELPVTVSHYIDFLVKLSKIKQISSA